MNMNQPKVLIIGSNGYIGKHLAKFLYEEGIPLRLCDVQPEPLEPEMEPFYTSLDVLDKEALTKINLDVDGVFLFSGLTGTSVGFRKYEEFITVNEVGLLNVLDRLKETQSKARVIFPSSRLVYKGQKGRKLKEDDEKEFKTIYALNKFACENYLKIYHECFGIDHTIFRICVPYGNLLGDYSYGTMSFLLDRAKQGQNIVLYGDGSQKRTFTHIYDICQILIKAAFLKNTVNDVFNIGSADHLSLFQIASRIAKKYRVKVEFSEWPALAQTIESGDTMFDSSKLDKLVDYLFKYKVLEWIDSLN
jgi:UDP-glucose 4-epimerase